MQGMKIELPAGRVQHPDRRVNMDLGHYYQYHYGRGGLWVPRVMDGDASWRWHLHMIEAPGRWHSRPYHLRDGLVMVVVSHNELSRYGGTEINRYYFRRAPEGHWKRAKRCAETDEAELLATLAGLRPEERYPGMWDEVPPF